MTTAPPRKKHPFGLLHRYGGISSAVAVIIICLTGLLLNHTDDLQLGRRAVTADWLLDWYGIEAPPPQSYSFGKRHASQLGSRLYLDAIPLDGEHGTLRGIATTEFGVVLATQSTVILLTEQGELIETLTELHGTPAGIEQIGVLADGRVVVRSDSASWFADATFTGWQTYAEQSAAIRWSATAEAPSELVKQVSAHYRGAGLSLERAVLDLHSGRIFGRAGVWLADLAAGVFILLAMTGIWMWWKTRRRKT